jgi:hypothetical protein
MRHFHTFILVAGLLSTGAVSAAGQTAPQRPATPSPPQMPSLPQRPSLPSTGPQQSSPGPTFLERPDARETRDRLNELFNQHPPSVREVLRIDPTLLYRPDYMANYPALAAFLEQHPEVAHNPGFFIGEHQFREENNNPRMEAVRAMRDSVEFAGVALIVMTIAAGIIFLVRTVVEHWRWQRAMKAQSELNTKLIDRFANNQELLAYLQSPQGRQLTDAPVLPQRSMRIMDAPLNRIFWSLQAGAVLACGGFGMLMASTRLQGELLPEGASVLFAFGLVVLTVGAGFLVSSAISYFLSQRLGLVRPLTTSYSGEAPGP